MILSGQLAIGISDTCIFWFISIGNRLIFPQFSNMFEKRKMNPSDIVSVAILIGEIQSVWISENQLPSECAISCYSTGSFSLKSFQKDLYLAPKINSQTSSNPKSQQSFHPMASHGSVFGAYHNKNNFSYPPVMEVQIMTESFKFGYGRPCIYRHVITK